VPFRAGLPRRLPAADRGILAFVAEGNGGAVTPTAARAAGTGLPADSRRSPAVVAEAGEAVAPADAGGASATLPTDRRSLAVIAESGMTITTHDARFAAADLPANRRGLAVVTELREAVAPTDARLAAANLSANAWRSPAVVAEECMAVTAAETRFAAADLPTNRRNLAVVTELGEAVAAELAWLAAAEGRRWRSRGGRCRSCGRR
jgi:hypothetical protein